MENFEYSVQLNDRDWAEFYLASEECSLIQPTLATADDHFFGDLERGEAEENRWVRVGAHHKAGCFSHESPDGPLPAEEVWSGSDDETDLGSVSRFLCNSHLDLPSSHTLSGRFSGISPEPLRSWPRPPGPAAKASTAFEALEKGAERVGGSVDPETRVKAPAFQGTVLQEPHPRREKEKRHWGSLVNLSAAEGMEGPAGTGGMEFQRLQDKTSEAASACLSEESAAFAGKPDFPGARDAALYPSSVCFSPAISFESGGVGDPGKDGKDHPLASTPFQERHAPPPEHPAPAGRALAQPIPLLAGERERTSGGRGEGARPLEKGRGAGAPRRFSPNRFQEEQLGGPPCDSGVKQFPVVLEENGRSSPAQMWGKTSGKVEKGKGAPHLRHGTASPFEEEHPVQVQGGQRLVSHPLKSKGSSESDVTDFTWPEMYDYFFSDLTLEAEGDRQEGAPGMDPNQEPPAVSGPEIYEYFFNEMEEPTVQKKRGERPRTPETVLSSDRWSAPSDVLEEPGTNAAAYALCIPEVYEHFFAHPTRGKRNWRQNFLVVPVSEVRKAVRALKSLIRRPVDFPRSQLRRRGSQAGLLLLSPALLEKGLSGRPENLEMALMQPERPLQPIFTPRDMCVGFVAFASWAVKTSDLQAPDAWKIVLLANFGTLSAIRYFRRQVVTEGRHGT